MAALCSTGRFCPIADQTRELSSRSIARAAVPIVASICSAALNVSLHASILFRCGEVVVPSENGTTDFSVLQNELKGKSTKIVLVAFDLLCLNGYDLRKLPLIERKANLKKIIAGTEIQFSESFEVEGAEMYAHACKVGLEGVVSKVRESKYSPVAATIG